MGLLANRLFIVPAAATGAIMTVCMLIELIGVFAFAFVRATDKFASFHLDCGQGNRVLGVG